jgi:hypothetical protein
VELLVARYSDEPPIEDHIDLEHYPGHTFLHPESEPLTIRVSGGHQEC